MRYEWLSQYHWDDLDHVQRAATQWMWAYNHERPNMALPGHRAPGGAKLEGVLRSHRRASNGTLRDTRVYSINAAEWLPCVQT